MGLNVFGALPPIPPGAAGPQAAVDLFGVAPPTGLDQHLTFIAKGDFTEGAIAVEISPDGTIWDVLGQFTAGNDADNTTGPRVEFSPLVEDAVIRFVRANVRAKVNGPNNTLVSFGAEQNCECASVPPPPN
jgi:hypothetical protein